MRPPPSPSAVPPPPRDYVATCLRNMLFAIVVVWFHCLMWGRRTGVL